MAKPKGGARPGAGRPPKAIEDDVKGAIKRALDSEGADTLDEIWRKIIQKAKEGSEKHAQIFLNYYHGKPKENQGEPSEMIINVIRND